MKLPYLTGRNPLTRALRYLPLTDKEEGSLSRQPRKSSGRTTQLLLFTAVAVMSGFVGAGLGSHVICRAKPHLISDPFLTTADLHINPVGHIFVYNRTFGADPAIDDNNQAAWDSIVPLGQGSVRYPPDTSQISTLSVIHQLHCLWTIHRNYYGSLHGEPNARAGKTLAHMRHCFDYLRQSLACAADLTLEPVIPELGGVTGWGVSRNCRDYGELKLWAEKYRVNNLRGFHDHHEEH